MRSDNSVHVYVHTYLDATLFGMTYNLYKHRTTVAFCQRMKQKSVLL